MDIRSPGETDYIGSAASGRCRMTVEDAFRRAGIAGIFGGIILTLLAWWLPTVLSPLALLSVDAWDSPWPARLFLLGLGLIVVMETPFMLWALTRLARAGDQNQLLTLTHLAYIAFPGIYALIGTVLSGQRWWAWIMLFLVGMRIILSMLAVPSQIQNE